jgi:hypothetical protein
MASSAFILGMRPCDKFKLLTPDLEPFLHAAPFLGLRKFFVST